MRAFARYNYEFMATPLISSGLISTETFEQGFKNLLEDHELTEDAYNSTPELLDTSSPFDILRYLLPERYVSSGLSEFDGEENIERLVAAYKGITKDDWPFESANFLGDAVRVKLSTGEVDIACDSEFEESLRQLIGKHVKKSAFLEWVSADYLNIIWLPLEMKEAIEQRFNSLQNRAAERLRRFKNGDRVTNKTYGKGTVINFKPSLNGDIIEIQFDNGEVKKFSDDVGESVKAINS